MPQDPSTHTLLSGNVWTGMFMDFELQDVILDLLLSHSSPDTDPRMQPSRERALARINFFRDTIQQKTKLAGVLVI